MQKHPALFCVSSVASLSLFTGRIFLHLLHRSTVVDKVFVSLRPRLVLIRLVVFVLLLVPTSARLRVALRG